MQVGNRSYRKPECCISYIIKSVLVILHESFWKGIRIGSKIVYLARFNFDQSCLGHDSLASIIINY